MGCVQTVPNDRVAVVTKFGKFDRLAHPGLLCLPVPCICVRAGDVSVRIQETSMTCETKTKDNVFVSIQVAVQYEVIKSKIYEAFYRLHNPTVQINSYVFDVVRSTVPGMLLDDVFESKDEEYWASYGTVYKAVSVKATFPYRPVAKQVKDQLQKIMSEFGFQINQALVTDISPNRKVRDAMNEINANRRLRVAATEKAEAEKVVIVKQAEAEAESKFLQGQGVARQRKAIVDGLRESVGDFQEAIHEMSAKDVLELVLVTQYFDTLKEVGSSSKANTVFVSTSQKSVTDEIKMGFSFIAIAMQVSRSLAAAANRIPAAAFFSRPPHRGIFDGFTVEGRNAKLDVTAIMPVLERANDGGVSVVREGRIKWTFSPKGLGRSVTVSLPPVTIGSLLQATTCTKLSLATFWKMPEYADPNIPSKIELGPSKDGKQLLISIAQRSEDEGSEVNRISVEAGPGDLKGMQTMMESLLPSLYGWKLIPIDVGDAQAEEHHQDPSAGRDSAQGSKAAPGPSVDDFFD
ncbi:HIR complex subunit [Perkinsus olseni]|uniref:HIR complex subunit n=1 Tax=Perkinsus olseni TaxID=32597 RepID=A0A7J6N850_PEROL|nr:HIR complex subunit [Perkinsus olseni]